MKLRHFKVQEYHERDQFLSFECITIIDILNILIISVI